MVVFQLNLQFKKKQFGCGGKSSLFQTTLFSQETF